MQKLKWAPHFPCSSTSRRHWKFHHRDKPQNQKLSPPFPASPTPLPPSSHIPKDPRTYYLHPTSKLYGNHSPPGSTCSTLPCQPWPSSWNNPFTSYLSPRAPLQIRPAVSTTPLIPLPFTLHGCFNYEDLSKSWWKVHCNHMFPHINTCSFDLQAAGGQRGGRGGSNSSVTSRSGHVGLTLLSAIQNNTATRVGLTEATCQIEPGTHQELEESELLL